MPGVHCDGEDVVGSGVGEVVLEDLLDHVVDAFVALAPVGHPPRALDAVVQVPGDLRVDHDVPV